jgi:phage-related protein (TIGR01555 family)
MDDAMGGMYNVIGMGGSGAPFTAQGFPGFPYLTELTQTSEYRDMFERVAAEMCRKWITFRGKGEDDKTERIGGIEDEFTRLDVRCEVRRAAERDMSMGRCQLFLNFGEDGSDLEERQELRTRIMLNHFKINPNNKLKSLKLIEPITTYPATVDSDNPLRSTFYVPRSWFVYGTEVDSTRLLTFTGRELPDLLKPAYNFSGVSLSQLAQPYVEYWLNTRDSVGEVLRNFSTVAFGTNMDIMLNPNAPALINRLQGYSETRRNNGVFMYDMATEKIELLNITLAGLDKLQAQAQEHMAAVAKTPLVVLLGITPTGLNQSAEGDMRVFYDYVQDQQEKLFRKPIQMLLEIVQLGLYGDVDPDITFDFVNLFSITGKEQALITKTTTDSDVALITAGVVSPRETRAKVARDPASGYNNLDVDQLPTPPPQPMAGKKPGGGFDPSGQAQMNSAMNAGSDEAIRLATDVLENALQMEGARQLPAIALSTEALEATRVLAGAGGGLALDSAIQLHSRALNAHRIAPAATSELQLAQDALVDAHGSALAILRLTAEALALDEAAGHEFRGNQWTGGVAGVHSVGTGKNRVWKNAQGKELGAKDSARLNNMGVPPAWTNVKLNPDPKAGMQVIGTDSKGRSQYLYSAEHSAAASAEKFERMKDFQKALPKIRAGIDREVEKGNDAAAVLSVVEKTGFRVGGDRNTGAEVDAFGASNLLGQHVTVTGSMIKFDYIGKHGVEIKDQIEDKTLAKYIRDRKKEAGPDGRIFQATDQDARDLLKQVSGNDKFKVKDFRTWHGTAKAIEVLGGRKAKDEAGFKALQKEVAIAVSEHLHNTPAVALRSYIAPEVWSRAKVGGF